MKVIALCGFKRCGKDTVADWLCKHRGYTKVKIADPLKEVCASLFCLNNDQLEGHLKEDVDERWGVSPRRIMQFFGTELMQYKIQELLPGIDRSFWIRNTISRCCNKCAQDNNKIVISDLRFMHEYDELARHFGKDIFFVKIMSNRVVTGSDCHPSEKEWESIPCNSIINNDGSLEDLHSQLSKVFYSTSA